MSCTALVKDVAEVPTLEAWSVCDRTMQKPKTCVVQATWAINILWQTRTATHDQTLCPPHAKNWLSGVAGSVVGTSQVVDVCRETAFAGHAKELRVPVTANTNPTQDQASPNPSMDERGSCEVSPLAKELWELTDAEGREIHILQS